MDEDVQRLLHEGRYRVALEKLLERYETKVFRTALAYLKDPARAEDVTQEIFLKLWQALPQYDGRAAPGTWLYTIARNTCLSAVRSEGYRKTAPMEGLSEPTATVSAVVGNLELEGCIARLPEIQRTVIRLFYLQEKQVDEVARILEMPEGTVKSHLHRARVALGLMMKEQIR